MKMKKILAMALAALLLVAVSVAGTVAFLTDTSSTLTNTFTESDVDIELSETTGETYKMVPGAEISKNPKVTVTADSEACYVFVKLVKSTDKAFDDYLTYTIAEGWTELDGVDGVYYRSVSDTDAAQEFAVLNGDKVEVKDGVTKAMMDALTTANYPKLTITAYAVQSANLNTSNMTEIWALAQTNGAVTD